MIRIRIPRLRLAVDKAAANNMPKDTVERAIKRGAGELEGVNYEEVRYEGYGINGAAVMVDCLTDNKTRTVADVRHAFTKMAATSAPTARSRSLQALRPDRVRARHERRQAHGSRARSRRRGRRHQRRWQHRSDHRAERFHGVRQGKLESAGFKPEFAEVTMKPTVENTLTGDDAARMQKLLDALESIDDVQEVYTTAVMDA